MKTKINLHQLSSMTWGLLAIFFFGIISYSCETSEPVLPETEGERRLLTEDEDENDEEDYNDEDYDGVCNGEMGEVLCIYNSAGIYVYNIVEGDYYPDDDFLFNENAIIDVGLGMEEREIRKATDPDCGYEVNFSSTVENIELTATDVTTGNTIDLAPYVIYIDYNYMASEELTMEEWLENKVFDSSESYFSFQMDDLSVLGDQVIFHVEFQMESQEVFRSSTQAFSILSQ